MPYEPGGGPRTLDTKPIKRFAAWASQSDKQRALWPGVIELTGEFYESLSDFVRFTPPDTVFYREIRRKCPHKLDGIYIYDSMFLIDMQSLFIVTLPEATQERIAAAVKAACKTDGPCDYKAMVQEEARLHLDVRHADFLCVLQGFPAAR